MFRYGKVHSATRTCIHPNIYNPNPTPFKIIVRKRSDHSILFSGAQHLVFHVRTICDKPNARKSIPPYKSMGFQSNLTKGDVLPFDNVTTAIKVCIATGKPIGVSFRLRWGFERPPFPRKLNALE